MYAIKNTFGIKVNATSYIEYVGVEDLRNSLEHARKPFLHIGSASNLLFTKDFAGTVFHCVNKSIEYISESGTEAVVRVGAGCLWDRFVVFCVEKGLYGVENLSLIPGEVGAAAVQNIGAYGAEASDVISNVHTFDTELDSTRIFSNEECRYSYRYSIFKESAYKKYFVYAVDFHLSKKPCFKLDYGNLKQHLKEESLSAIRSAVIEIRRAKLPDPEQIGSAGSFFMNPVIPAESFSNLAIRYPDIPHYPAPDGKIKLSAGWLIEQCGWRGKSLGKAAVYPEQALVIVNTGGAEGSDILALADAVMTSVREKFGVQLKMEVQVI